jgi:hypothetical protein
VQPFHTIIRFIARFSKPENSFCEPLVLEYTDRHVYLKPASLSEPQCFFAWFKWVFFIVAMAMSVMPWSINKGDGWLGTLFMSCFSASCLLIGLSAFYIVPQMIRVFDHINASLHDFKRFPYINEDTMELSTPALDRAIKLSDIQSVFSSRSSERGWLQLQVKTAADGTVFLVNYPQSQQALLDQFTATLQESMCC